VAEQTVFWSDVGSQFQARGSAIENAQELAAWKYEEWYDIVLKVSWCVSECDTVHQDAQLV